MAQRISPSGLAPGGAFVWAATSATGVQASRADRRAETTRARHRARSMYPSTLKGDDRVGARTIAPRRQAVNTPLRRGRAAMPPSLQVTLGRSPGRRRSSRGDRLGEAPHRLVMAWSGRLTAP